MYKILIAILFLTSTLAYSSNDYVKWTGSKVVGDSHTGSINIKKSDFNFDGNDLKGGYFEIDMKSIKNTDLEGDWNAKLVQHLSSNDFFDVNKFPTSKFKITSVKETNKNGKYLVTGDLTIKGVTKKVSFDAESEIKGDVISFKALIEVDRTKFNIKYGSDSFFDNLADKAISDIFSIDLLISTKIK